jgi:hypothetical protein
MLDRPSQTGEVNVVIHSQGRFKETVDLVVNGRQFGVQLLHFCETAGHVGVMSFLFKAFAIRLRGSLQCDLRPLLGFPRLLSPACRGHLFASGGTLALFSHFRLVLHFR